VKSWDTVGSKWIETASLSKLANGVGDRGVGQINYSLLGAAFKPEHGLVTLVDSEHLGVITAGPAQPFQVVPGDVLGQGDTLSSSGIENEVQRAFWLFGSDFLNG
jgi:hypothetical protein